MSTDQSSDGTLVYVGTYTRTEPHVEGKAEGIYVYRMDRNTGVLRHQSTATGVGNPSFVAVDARRRYLYAVQELDQFDGQAGGAATAFAIDPDSGDLTLLNHQPTHGAHPCYVSIDHSGRYLLVANYGGGSVTVLPIGEDGTVQPATDVVQHHGPAPHHTGPHPHSIISSPDGGFVLVPDCGLDKIFVYRLDLESGKLVANDPPAVELRPASGPRHLAWHPNGTTLYAITERGSSLAAFTYDPEHGTLAEFQMISSLPDDFDGRNACADIHIDPAGRHVYGSNRGHNSIAIFAVDAVTGEAQPRGHVSSGGRTPRNFAIDAQGRFLLAANQDSSTVLTFGIDQNTGALSPSGHVADIPTPVCLVMID